ncbi:MAG: Maf family protein [Breznakia sp.]
MIRLMLASASPRRKTIWTQVQLDFTIRASPIEEVLDNSLPIAKAIENIAVQKIAPIVEDFFNAMVVGCDTVVVKDGTVLKKPKDKQEAKQMLKQLSNATHQVISGVAISYKGKMHQFSEISEVCFYPLRDEDIDIYINSAEPFDKAGAYGIQGKGCIFVKSICGDYNNIVGFPMSRFLREVEQVYGVNVMRNDEYF